MIKDFSRVHKSGAAVANALGVGCGVNSKGTFVKPATNVALCLGLTGVPFLYIIGVGEHDELTIFGKGD